MKALYSKYLVIICGHDRDASKKQNGTPFSVLHVEHIFAQTDTSTFIKAYYL